MALSKYQQAASGFLPVPQAGARSNTDSAGIDPDTRIATPADPVNSYVSPGPVKKSPLWAMAESLQIFDSSLAPILAKKQREQDDADAVQAQADFLKNNEEGFAEAVRTGAIPANASPVFVQAYKEMEGRRIARDTESSLYTNYQNSDIRTSEDPNAFTPWVTSQTKGALDGITDPYILRGAVPGITKAVSQLGHAHAVEAGKAAMARATNGVGSDIVGAISDASAEPAVGPDGKLHPWAGVTNGIISAVQNGRKIGIPEVKLQKMATDAIVAKATQERDVDLLGMLPKDIADSPYALKEITRAHDAILIKTYNDEVRADHTHARAAKEERDNATRDAIQVLTADPNGEIPESVLQAGESADPQFRLKVEDIRSKMRANATKVDPAREGDAYLRINTAPDPVQQAIKEIGAGNIANPQRINSTLYTAQRLKQSLDRGEASILKSPVTKQYEKALRGRFAGDFPDPVTGRIKYDEAGYGRALVEYHSALAGWEADNPSATMADRLKASRDVGETLLKNYGVTLGGETMPRPALTVQAPAASAPPRLAAPLAAVAPRDDTLDQLRRRNPALRALPDSLLRRYFNKPGNANP